MNTIQHAVHTLGLTCKDYNIGEDNYFIVINTRDNLYYKFTVNDGFMSPERMYFDKETAEKIVQYLNSTLKEINE